MVVLMANNWPPLTLKPPPSFLASLPAMTESMRATAPAAPQCTPPPSSWSLSLSVISHRRKRIWLTGSSGQSSTATPPPRELARFEAIRHSMKVASASLQYTPPPGDDVTRSALFPLISHPMSRGAPCSM